MNTFEQSIFIHSDRKTIWDVLTKKKYTLSWGAHFGNGLWLDTDGLIHSLVSWKDQQGNLVFSGEVTGSVPYKLLSFSYFSDHRVLHRTERFVFVDDAAGVNLTLRIQSPTDEAAQWKKILIQLKKIAERAAAQ